MREILVGDKDDGRRLEKYLSSSFTKLSPALAQKYVRLGRVRVNGIKAKLGAHVAKGDVLNLYIEDELLAADDPVEPLYRSFRPHINALYEDENVLVVDKRPGLLCHPDDREKVDTLLTHARAYLFQKGGWSGTKGSFHPVLVNRIDRFTGGIVIIAKTEEALGVLNQKIRDGEIDKYYLCAVGGRLKHRAGVLDNYLLQEGKKVRVFPRPTPEAKRAVTHYRVLREAGGLSLVECLLETGRTHQIRAQFADAGHPLLGDTQYGDARLNARYGRGYQALYAYKVVFAFQGDAGALEYLTGREIAVPDVPFVRDFFPE